MQYQVTTMHQTGENRVCPKAARACPNPRRLDILRTNFFLDLKFSGMVPGYSRLDWQKVHQSPNFSKTAPKCPYHDTNTLAKFQISKLSPSESVQHWKMAEFQGPQTKKSHFILAPFWLTSKKFLDMTKYSVWTPKNHYLTIFEGGESIFGP